MSSNYSLQRARTAKKIETPADLEGFPELKDEEKDEIKKLIAEFDVSKSPTKPAAKASKTGKTGTKASKGSGAAKAGTTRTALFSSGIYVHV